MLATVVLSGALRFSLVIASCAVVCVLVAALSWYVWRSTRTPYNHDGQDSWRWRVCCYCGGLSSELMEESSRLADDVIVLTRTYVCRACGLPQWHVSRNPQLHHTHRDS